MKDEYVIVLDFLEHGHSSGRSQPIAQAIGKENFNLLELVIREGHFPKLGDVLYIGDGPRDEVKFIKGKISFEELTGNSKSELEFILEELVKASEEKFVKFFNEAEPINTRMHTLELIPGIGKKHMWEIIEERENNPFKSFSDIKKRVKLLPNPEKMIVKRIIEELTGEEKRYIFVSPSRERERWN